MSLKRSHPGITRKMMRGIVGGTPSVYADLNPVRPTALLHNTEEPLRCHKSVLILVHVRSAHRPAPSTGPHAGDCPERRLEHVPMRAILAAHRTTEHVDPRRIVELVL